MARIFSSAFLIILAMLSTGCAGGFSHTTVYSSNLPQQPRIAPGTLPVPSVAYGVIPPGATVTNVACGVNDNTSFTRNGYGSGSGTRSCIVEFTTLQGKVCTTRTSEGGGMSSSTRSASLPNCKPAAPTPVPPAPTKK